MNEDDTYRLLKRQPFDVVHRAVRQANLITGNQRNQILKAHGWNNADYEDSLKKYWESFTHVVLIYDGSDKNNDEHILRI